MMRYLMGGHDLPFDRGRHLFGTLLRTRLGNGCVDVADAGEAAALWAPPGHWKASFAETLRASPGYLRGFGLRVLANLRVLSAIQAAHPSAPHWYLEVLGTDPAHQGKGLGAAVLQPGLDRCDVEGLGAYLESSKEANVPFYARFGFEVTGEIVTPKGGPKVWLMWREAR